MGALGIGGGLGSSRAWDGLVGQRVAQPVLIPIVLLCDLCSAILPAALPAIPQPHLFPVSALAY